MRNQTNGVLVLNATYEAISFCSVRRGLALILSGKAYAEEWTERWMHSMRFSSQVPLVIRLLEYTKKPFQRLGVSRKKILLRDLHMCQYCLVKFSEQELTLDHIIPRCQKGPTSWENLVACCKPCNSRKDGRTPEQAGMKLRHRPQPRTGHTQYQLLRSLGSPNEVWRRYLFY